MATEEVQLSVNLTPSLSPKQEPNNQNTEETSLTINADEFDEVLQEINATDELKDEKDEMSTQYHCICGKPLIGHRTEMLSRDNTSRTSMTSSATTDTVDAQEILHNAWGDLRGFNPNDSEHSKTVTAEEEKQTYLSIVNASQHISTATPSATEVQSDTPINNAKDSKEKPNTTKREINIEMTPTPINEAKEKEKFEKFEKQQYENDQKQLHTAESQNKVLKFRFDSNSKLFKSKCYLCKTEMNAKHPRYECEDYHFPKSKNCHISYCETCYDEMRNMHFSTTNTFGYVPKNKEKQINLKNEREEKLFGDDGYEITTTNRTGPKAPESSDHETDTSHPSSTNPPSSPETTPRPKKKGKDYDFYKFNVKLKKMIIDHKDKVQQNTKQKNVLYPVQAVFVSKHDDKNDPDRICYISVELDHLSITERFETGTGECDCKMVIKVYWILSESDYIKYNELEHRNKQQHLLFSAKEFECTFIPKIDIKNAAKFVYNDKREQQQIKLIDINSFFGKNILNKMRSISTDYNNILFGFMAEITYFVEATILEPFEVENFPYDCQDIPIIIEGVNFKTLAPAYFGNENKNFIIISGDTTNLGRWNMRNTITEFHHKTNGRNVLRVMLKLKRYSAPYLLETFLLIGAVCALAMTAFSIDDEDEAKQERLAIILGLILTLIFIDLPDVPNVTLLHKYYYTSFGFLVLLAIHFAGETSYARNILFIEDPECYADEDECQGYQQHNYNLMFFLAFGGLYTLYHIVFIVVSTTVNASENKKLQMTWSQIRKKVEKKDDHSILTSSDFWNHAKDEKRKNAYERIGSTDIIRGQQVKVSHEDEEDALGFDQGDLKRIQNRLNRQRDSAGQILELIAIILLILSTFVVLPNLASFLQFFLLRSERCVGSNRIGEQFAFACLCGFQALLCLVHSFFWFDVCAGDVMRALIFFSIPFVMGTVLANYVLAIRSFGLYFHATVTCTDVYLEDLLYSIFLIWVVGYSILFGLVYLYYSFGEGDTLVMEEEDLKKTKDGNVKFFHSLGKHIREQDLPSKYRYFGVKTFTTVAPIMIQFPATILLLLLVGRQCTGNSKDIIGMGGSVTLLCLSFIFHVIRAILQGKNAFFLYYTEYTSCYWVVSILAMHAFVSIATYWDNNRNCEFSNLYNMLWYCLLLWILYDCMSIVGIMIEFYMNWFEIRKKVVPFLSIMVIASVMFLQLPANIGALYVILRNDITSAFVLSSNKIVSFLVVIWLQILAYGSMQNKRYQDYSIFAVYFFLFIIHILTLESFLFWIFVDDVTVASVCFSILFGFGIFYDTVSLFVPSFMIPMAAYQFYGKAKAKNGMVRSMLAQFIIFIGIQMPACIMQLFKGWKGVSDTISSTEGASLFVLTWISLIVSFVYAFLYFDTNPKVREYIRVKFPKLYRAYSNHNNIFFVKYVLYLNTLIIWILIVHCFSFWNTKKHRFGTLWWFFCCWIVIYTISSIGPALTYVWLMFYYRNLRKLVNNVYIFMAVFVYVFIQLPASILQLSMIEFKQCIDNTPNGHSLDDGMFESFCIIVFTLVQLILFYAMCDVLDWNDDAQQAKIEMTNSKKEKWRNKEILKFAERKKNENKLKETDEEFVLLGFNRMSELKSAIYARRRQISAKKEKKRWMRKHGKYFVRVFVAVCLVQFGLAIHSFTYWAKKDSEIICGCDIDGFNDLKCTDDTISKRLLFWLFLLWIGLYCLLPIISMGLAVFRDNIDSMIKKRGENKNESENKNENESENKNVNKK